MKMDTSRPRQPSDEETSFVSMCKRMEDDDHEASRFNKNITDIKVTKVLLNTNIMCFIFIANIMQVHHGPNPRRDRGASSVPR